MIYNISQEEVDRMKRGDTAYIIISNVRVEPVLVIRVNGNLITVKLPTGGAIRVPAGRLYATAEEAAARLPRQEPPQYRTPYDF